MCGVTPNGPADDGGCTCPPTTRHARATARLVRAADAYAQLRDGGPSHRPRGICDAAPQSGIPHRVVWLMPGLHPMLVRLAGFERHSGPRFDAEGSQAAAKSPATWTRWCPFSAVPRRPHSTGGRRGRGAVGPARPSSGRPRGLLPVDDEPRGARRTAAPPGSCSGRSCRPSGRSRGTLTPDGSHRPGDARQASRDARPRRRDVEEGTIGGEQPNAADFQILSGATSVLFQFYYAPPRTWSRAGRVRQRLRDRSSPPGIGPIRVGFRRSVERRVGRHR